MNIFVQIGVNAVVGLLLQLLVALLLCAVFLAERARGGGGGGYMGFWNAAWLAQALAIGALVLEFLFLPNLDILQVYHASLGAVFLNAVYGSAKMVFWACLLMGCGRNRRAAISGAAARFLFGACQAYAAVVLGMGRLVDQVAVGLYPAVLVGSVCCAVAVARGARSRARAGPSLALSGAFLANGACTAGILWYHLIPGLPEGRWLINNNSYVDCVLHLALAAAMIWTARSDRAHAEVTTDVARATNSAPRADRPPHLGR